jgi:amino acid transporter
MANLEHEPAPLVPTPVRRDTGIRRLRRLLLGSPVSSEHMEHTLLPKFLALPVFASDAISSVAYATQQIILALGAAGLYLLEPDIVRSYTRNTLIIAGLIVLLLVIVVFSYWQTIFAYPKGGGSYIVTKDNLGTQLGLIAAAALLIDYVLTVSVSIASGVQNLTSIPFARQWHLDQHLVWICLLFIAALTLANLRGLKESGAVFAIFTYGFVAMCYIMIAVALIGPFLGWVPHLEHIRAVYDQWPAESARRSAQAFGAVVMLRAFANGCSAMTGTEAVSDGIPAFQEPKSKNAALTLASMGVILGTIFIGVTWLAMRFHVVYWEHDGKTAPAVIDQISGAVFGKTGTFSFAYLLTQFFTAAVLVLAANTAFADFPRLSSFLARDRFAPKQFANLGDKLVFNNGIVLLGVFAAVLIVVKQGQVDALIPLYATGVFTAFTLSQSSMVVRWNRIKGPGWRQKAFINGFGALTTFIVLGFIVFEKFREGAWIVIVLIALLVVLFRTIHHHYSDVAAQLRLPKAAEPEQPFHNTVLVLVPGLHRGMLSSLTYARSLSPDCRAVYIETDPEKTQLLKSRWEEWSLGIPLVILNSPYRSLAAPIMQYLDAVQTERHHHLVTVIVPEFVSTRWWHNLLHGNSGLLLKFALMARKDVIVTNVRYYLQEMESPPPSDALAEEVTPTLRLDDGTAKAVHRN